MSRQFHCAAVYSTDVADRVDGQNLGRRGEIVVGCFWERWWVEGLDVDVGSNIPVCCF